MRISNTGHPVWICAFLARHEFDLDDVIVHVGIIAPEFPPELGGIQSYAFEFACELIRQGCRVTVLTRAHSEGEVTVEGMEVVAGLRLRRRYDAALIRKFHFDVWHVMNAAYAWVADHVAPVVVSVHGNDFLRPYILVDRPDLGTQGMTWRFAGALAGLDRVIGQSRTNRLIRRTLPRAGHIMANSRYTESTLLETYPKCRGLTSVGLVGVGQQFLEGCSHSRAGHEGRPHLITVCRLEDPRKNVDLVLRALARLMPDHEFSYTVVGDGRLRSSLEQLSFRLGLGDRVDFAGAVSNDRLRVLLGSSDLFVLTSSVRPGSHEGFGIAYLEAGACGVPVLAARKAGAIEAVDEGVSGYFVEEADEEEIVAALRRFLDNRISFDADACRAFARGFTWERVVGHALDVYRRLNSREEAG